MATLHIAILPFRDVAPTELEALVRDLRPHGIQAHLLPPASLPERSYDSERGQYRAELFVESARAQHPGMLVLGVTDVDLYSGRLNFVFGIAESPGQAALISLHRLRIAADTPTFRARAVKEAVHEIGHALGLRHCSDSSCVMYFSNSLGDTDRKQPRFCPLCRAQFEQRI